MSKVFLKKIIGRELSDLTAEELKVIINNNSIFQLNKKDTKVLEKILNSNTLDENRDEVTLIVEDGLPSTFVILNNLDKCGIKEGGIEINFREALISNLRRMNNLQLCVFIDKVLKCGKEEKLRFFRHRDYSLHEINSVISRSLGLTLVFEIFKAGKAKNFKAIDYNRIDKEQMIEVLDEQFARYLYILEIISEIVLFAGEASLLKTKINKVIKERIKDYLVIIYKEKSAVRATGVAPRQTWTYTLCNLTEVTIEDDEEFFDEEEDDE